MFVSGLLKLIGLSVVDKRGVGGCLWVVPFDEDFGPVKSALAQRGIEFHYCPKSKTIKKTLGYEQPAWWTSYNGTPSDQLEAIQTMLKKAFAMNNDVQPKQLMGTTVVAPQIVATDTCSESQGEFAKPEVKRICNTCAFSFDCHEAFTYYDVGCDRHIVSYQYAH